MMRSVSTMMALFAMGVSANDDSIQITVPSANSGRAFLQSETTSRENTQVWVGQKQPVARMQNFPPTYAGGFYDIKTADLQTTPANAQVKYVCPPNAGPCEVAVFVYDCSPCPAQKDGLQQYLIHDMNYERTRCAPTFTLETQPHHYHRMTAYVKSIPENTIETLILPNAVDFIAFAMSNGERPACSAFPDQSKCENTDLRCEWKNYNCVLRQCVQQGPYPTGGCTTCAAVSYYP